MRNYPPRAVLLRNDPHSGAMEWLERGFLKSDCDTSVFTLMLEVLVDRLGVLVCRGQVMCTKVSMGALVAYVKAVCEMCE